ncbi:MAG: PKD domain-containing protein, partial [Candidatus Peribacteraceae bacterium]|nr:PKD domain-containing protein [Candidatus Peribacteraceae bacterium]
MADDVIPPTPPSPPPAASAQAAPAVDAVSASPGAVLPPENVVRAKKKSVLLLLGIFNAVFIFWCAFLLLALPSPTGEGGSLLSVGLLSILVGEVIIIGLALLGLKRISVSTVSIETRRRSLIKLIAVLLPGFLIGVVTPFFIMGEPALPLDIVEPATAAELVAPVAVTLSAERATTILGNLGFRVSKYQWDADGDGTMNEETVTPTATVLIERPGVYVPIVRIVLEGGSTRRAARRISIPTAVFSVTPAQPVVEKAVKFSVAGLLTDPKLLKQVQWDFGDGNPPVTTTTADAAYTYYAVGDYAVTALMQMQNQSQATYKRTVAVRDPPPLPFAITMTTEPKTLVGPAPFGVLFRLESETPLKEIAWSFGDGKEDRGAALLRQSHVFESAGIYSVVVRARSEDGTLAELTAIVRATEVLTLRDLQFEGVPTVLNGKASGEVPIDVRLTPKTSTPLVQFRWEVPDELDAQANGSTLLGVFRKEGTYSVTLMGEGAEGKSVRMPITFDVKPPSAEPVISLTPD